MIAVITYLWDRPAIEEIVIDYYAALRDASERELYLVAAYSEETQQSTIDRLERRGWHFALCTSAPLSKKLNQGISALQGLPYLTHVVTFGSDDLIHPDAFELLCQAGEEYPVAGFSGAYLLDTIGRRAAHFVDPPSKRSRPCGAGRILQRSVLERLKWKLRPGDVTFHLDYALDTRLRSIGVTWHVIPHKSLSAPVVDVKTGRNLAGFDSIMRHGATLCDWDEVVRAFGEPWVGRLEGIVRGAGQ